MKRSLLLLSGFLCSGVVGLPAKTFTSTKGQVIEGEMVDASLTEVTIRRKVDGRTVKVPLPLLIEADQKEIAAWRQAKAATKVTVTATKDKVTSQSRSGGGNSSAVDSKDQQWNWVITVKNNSAYPVSGITLDWAQVVERKDRNSGGSSGPAKTEARRSNGSAPVPEIPAFGSVKITTQPITVQAYKSTSVNSSTTTSGDTVTEVTTYKWDESLSGLGLILMRDNQPIHRWKTGTDPGPVK